MGELSCVDKKGLLHTQRVSTFTRGPRGIGLIKVEFWMKAESMRAAVSGAVPSVELREEAAQSNYNSGLVPGPGMVILVIRLQISSRQ